MLPSSNYFPFPQGQPLSQLLTGQIFFVCFCSLYKWKHIVCTILIIEIKFTCHRIQPFEMYNSLVFSIATELYLHYYNQFFVYSLSPKETLFPFPVIPCSLPIPSFQLQATTILLLVSINLPILNIHLNGSLQYVVFCEPAPFIQRNVFKVHQLCTIYKYILHSFFYCQIMFYCMEKTHFIYPLISQ